MGPGGDVAGVRAELLPKPCSQNPAPKIPFGERHGLRARHRGSQVPVGLWYRHEISAGNYQEGSFSPADNVGWGRGEARRRKSRGFVVARNESTACRQMAEGFPASWGQGDVFCLFRRPTPRMGRERDPRGDSWPVLGFPSRRRHKWLRSHLSPLPPHPQSPFGHQCPGEVVLWVLSQQPQAAPGLLWVLGTPWSLSGWWHCRDPGALLGAGLPACSSHGFLLSSMRENTP